MGSRSDAARKAWRTRRGAGGKALKTWSDYSKSVKKVRSRPVPNAYKAHVRQVNKEARKYGHFVVSRIPSNTTRNVRSARAAAIRAVRNFHRKGY